jgi:hypothetical protein
MALFSRWVRTPAEIRRLFAPQERMLALGDGPAGSTVVVASQLGLWVHPDDSSGWRRIGWDRIVKATWADGRLEIVEGDTDADGVVSDRPPVSFALDQPRNVPSVVRNRVEASIARTEMVTVPGGSGRVVARRVPGVDGLHWTARLDSGTPWSVEAQEALARYRRIAAENSAETPIDT